MNTKETWIDHTMESIDGINTLEAPPGMFQNVMGRLSRNNPKVIALRPQFAWAVAAGMALLLCINTITLLQYNKSNHNDKVAVKEISAEYFSYTEQF
jgi:hypothetical protein